MKEVLHIVLEIAILLTAGSFAVAVAFILDRPHTNGQTPKRRE